MKYIDGLRSERAELEKQLENKIEETVELIAEDPEAIDMESTLLSLFWMILDWKLITI